MIRLSTLAWDHVIPSNTSVLPAQSTIDPINTYTGYHGDTASSSTSHAAKCEHVTMTTTRYNSIPH